MSNLAYYNYVGNGDEKQLVWLSGGIEKPPFSPEAKREAGFLLRRLQQGELLSLPQSRPMPTIGNHCHELRIPDRNTSWRIVYQVYDNAIVILEIFSKKTNQTPQGVIDICKQRIKAL